MSWAPRLIFALTCDLLAAFAARPALAMPLGYFIDSTQAFAPRPDLADYGDGDFTLLISREYDDSTAARLLGIAEATYPPRSTLTGLSNARGTEIGPDSARISLWWYDGVGVGRVPYAVTAGALSYYTRLTERFRSHNFWGSFAHPLFWTDLSYHATITYEKEFYVGRDHYTNVYVAEMNLLWCFDDGTFVPGSLAHRMVILEPEGDVLLVLGDGETRESVRFSTHRAVGGVDTVMR